ncbi:restriction endonuclease, partial [Mycobacterium tuberculosis]|uniref:restriction endonuclease n=1 Tax=Mycobacterium tuberculosis TaxID=1773 RepID=UPI0004F3BDD6
MGSVHDVIEAFRKAPSNAERGTKFEQLMVRYFELDPTMAQQYDAVWRWIDWPERRGRTDTGIDLVAVERGARDQVRAVDGALFRAGPDDGPAVRRGV